MSIVLEHSRSINAVASPEELLTSEGRGDAVQRAIDQAKGDPHTDNVYVKRELLPYTLPSSGGFETDVKMTREGGNPLHWDVLAYGAPRDGSSDDGVAAQGAFDGVGAKGGGRVYFSGDGDSYFIDTGVSTPASGSYEIEIPTGVTILAGPTPTHLFTVDACEKMRWFGGGKIDGQGNVGRIIIGLGSGGTVVGDMPLTTIIEDLTIEHDPADKQMVDLRPGDSAERLVRLEKADFVGSDNSQGRCVNIEGHTFAATVVKSIDCTYKTTAVGLRVINGKRLTSRDDHFSDHMVQGIEYAGQKDADEIDPSKPYSAIVIETTVDLSGNTTNTSGQNQKGMSFGEASGPVLALGCTVFGNTAQTTVGISDDSVRSVGDVTGGDRAYEGYSRLCFNAVKDCQKGIASNSQRSITSHNRIRGCTDSSLQLGSQHTDFEHLLADGNLCDGAPIKVRGGTDVTGIWTLGLSNVVVNVSGPKVVLDNMDLGGVERPVLALESSTDVDEGALLHDFYSVDTSGGARNFILPHAGRMTPGQVVTVVNAAEHSGVNNVKVKRYFETFTDSEVSTGDDQITVTAHDFFTGQPVQLENSGGTLPAPLNEATTYYVIVVDDNTIQLATSKSDAEGGTAIDITGASGGGTHGVGDGLYDETGSRIAPTGNITLSLRSEFARFQSILGGWVRIR